MNVADKHYDLVVLGGGPAGTPVAMEYAKLSPEKKVLLVDAHGELGGECLFDGCIPSKIMEISARHIRELRSLKELGIELNNTHYKLVWEKIVERKEQILSHRTNSAKENFALLENAQLIKAIGSFVDEKTLLLSFEDGTSDEISFTKCVIATGSKAFIPAFKGNASGKIWTNEDFFDKMLFPQSMTIIGDGPIAIEFAQILSALGSQINIIGRKNRILKNVDSEYAEHIMKQLEDDKNINLILNATVEEINYKDVFTLLYTQGGVTKSVTSERMMSATGRVANVDTLALEKAGVKLSKHGIETDKSLLTSNKNIYANGDIVAGFPKFAHTAMYGAHTVAQNLFLEHNFFKVDFDKNSWVLFSSPNIAMAGISEAEANKRGIEVIVGVYDYSIDAKAQIENEEKAYLKFIVEKSSNKIIGVSIMENEANAIAGEAALIVANGLGLKDLIGTIHPHPTLSEAFGFLAKQMMGSIMVEKLKSPFIQGALKVERFL